MSKKVKHLNVKCKQKIVFVQVTLVMINLSYGNIL